MARPKGGKNRRWTNEERLKYVHMYLNQGFSAKELLNDYGVPLGTLDGWVRRYQKGGEEALNPDKLHPGNSYSALYTSKSLSENEKLTLLVEKLQIENERLKKGYTVKGVGANKEFVTLKDLNSK